MNSFVIIQKIEIEKQWCFSIFSTQKEGGEQNDEEKLGFSGGNGAGDQLSADYAGDGG